MHASPYLRPQPHSQPRPKPVMLCHLGRTLFSSAPCMANLGMLSRLVTTVGALPNLSGVKTFEDSVGDNKSYKQPGCAMAATIPPSPLRGVQHLLVNATLPEHPCGSPAATRTLHQGSGLSAGSQAVLQNNIVGFSPSKLGRKSLEEGAPSVGAASAPSGAGFMYTLAAAQSTVAGTAVPPGAFVLVPATHQGGAVPMPMALTPDTLQAMLQQSGAPTTSATTTLTHGADLQKVLKSVCKVFTTIASPNYATPWQMHTQTKSTASGFVIAPLSSRRILTNAHAVANCVQVQLRKHGNAHKFPARVLAVGHECDMAMLTVDDDAFWEGVEPLEVDGLPSMQETVCVVGYPTGGDNVCVTKGVVSRIDRQHYSHGRTSLLAVQIDAAINSGNSGGPVVQGDKVVGIAFQCLTQGENIGYVIPTPVMTHFLNDLERHDGRYTGFCDLGISWQTLENADHRASLGLPIRTDHSSKKKVTADGDASIEGCDGGVYVCAVEPCYPAAEVLKPGDVITHFNGHNIADDGTFTFTWGGPSGTEGSNAAKAVSNSSCTSKCVSNNNNASGTECLHTLCGPAPVHKPAVATGSVRGKGQQSVQMDFRHLVSMHYEGDECTLGVWRDGAPVPGGVHVKLTTPKHLVPVHSHDVRPHYFIFGGLVFTRLTNFYLRSTFGTDWTHKAPIKLCDRSFGGVMEAHGQEAVILSKVLAWEVNSGYQDLGNVEVLRVCGVRVHNLAHLAYLLTHATGRYVTLDLTWNKVVVLDAALARAAGADIAHQNCIPKSHFPANLLDAPLVLPEDLRVPTEAATGRPLPVPSVNQSSI